MARADVNEASGKSMVEDREEPPVRHAKWRTTCREWVVAVNPGDLQFFSRRNLLMQKDVWRSSLTTDD
jgi:hypothetical protein